MTTMTNTMPSTTQATLLPGLDETDEHDDMANSRKKQKNKTSPRTNTTGSHSKSGTRKPAEKTPAATVKDRKSAGSARSAKVVTAETLARGQREISVSEFFAKNRHLLGFDNPRKAMLTAIKEAVDNALDACEEAHILPSIVVRIDQLDETRFRVTVRDNGPGIVRGQVENIFGKLLYGSKFHRLKMSRGQQGIGISAAGMYGLMTTGKPVIIISKTSRRKHAHRVVLKMDTMKNRANVIEEKEEHPEYDEHFPDGTGTEVTIELEGKYLKGRQSIDDYLEQTAIANPHAKILYVPPSNERVEFKRTIEELPPEPTEIKPHPNGIELGTLIQMLERTKTTQLGEFLQKDFSRIGQGKAKELCDRAQKILGRGHDASTITNRTYVSRIGHSEAEAIYKAIQEVRITAPPTDCVVPIGTRTLLAGLLKEVRAEFYSASTRPPTVYRGRPFIIEAAIAYGGDLPREESVRIIRFANRVPLLYQQSACSSFKAVVETNWRNYGMSQPKNALPVGPLVVMIHMASVWVPFTSESKEAIADYDEIRKEMKLALQECGRKLQTYVRRRQRMARQGERRDVFLRYIGEIARACEAITGNDAKAVYDSLMAQARKRTAEADQVLDDEGKVVDAEDDGGRLARDESVVIRDDVMSVSERDSPNDGADDDLFGGSSFTENGNASRRSRSSVKNKSRRSRR